MRLHPSLSIAALICVTSLLATSVDAQTGGFDLAWHDCIGLPSAAQNLDYACDGSRSGNPFNLVLTFTPPSDLAHFVGVQVVMEVRTGASSLPDWWRFAPGEYRAGALSFPGSRAGIGTGATGACIDPWASAANVGGGYQWTSNEGVSCGHPSYGCGGGYGPGYGLLQLAVARDSEVPLQAGQRYLLPPILLDPDLNPDPGNPGCSAPTCVFVYQVDLFQTVGQVPPQQDFYRLSRPIERAFVTWQSGQIGSECSNAVPVKRATWGAIKSIYR